jgi:hypothetical protein
LASLCLLDELLNGVVHDVASDEPRITPLAYMIIRDATIKQQNNAKYRDPDRLNNAAQELKRIAKTYQKLSGSRAIGPVLSLDENRSISFNQLISGIRKLLGVKV